MHSVGHLTSSSLPISAVNFQGQGQHPTPPSLHTPTLLLVPPPVPSLPQPSPTPHPFSGPFPQFSHQIFKSPSWPPLAPFLTPKLRCSMARLDRVKNLSGLAEWFAANQRLRKLVNLVIIGKYPNPPPPPSLSQQTPLGPFRPCCLVRKSSREISNC